MSFGEYWNQPACLYISLSLSIHLSAYKILVNLCRELLATTVLKHQKIHCIEVVCGVRNREVDRRPHNLEVPSSIPGSGCQLQDFFIGQHIWREYWCSSQEAELREISISCKNFFFNQCKINMFELERNELFKSC